LTARERAGRAADRVAGRKGPCDTERSEASRPINSRSSSSARAMLFCSPESVARYGHARRSAGAAGFGQIASWRRIASRPTASTSTIPAVPSG
jgi:hypothetical protein